MELSENAERFDALQPWYVWEMIESIKRSLVEAGIKGEKLKELCGSIAFTVCAQIDGSAGFEVDGHEYDSILAFADESGDLFYPGGNSFLHEYVFGVLDEIFEANE